jgi:hypothetical protein
MPQSRSHKATRLAGIALMLLALPAAFFLPRFQEAIFALTFVAGLMLTMLAMKRRVLSTMLGTVLPIALLVIAIGYPQIKPLILLEQKVASFRHPSNATAIAAECRKLLRGADTKQEILDKEKDMPPALAALHPRYIVVERGLQPSVRIEFGGGHRDYGYIFEPLENSSTEWHLYFYDGNDSDDAPPSADLAVLRE